MVISEEPTRKTVKRLTQAGWVRGRREGSHSVWICANGKHKVSVADGHRMTSAGMVRKIDAALASCTCDKGVER